MEINSDIVPDILTARHVMRDLRAQLATLVEEGGLALVSAGSHPMAIWLNEHRSLYERYCHLEQALQDVARSILIFALHIHIGIESHQRAVALINQLVTEAGTMAFCQAHLAHCKCLASVELGRKKGTRSGNTPHLSFSCIYQACIVGYPHLPGDPSFQLFLRCVLGNP